MSQFDFIIILPVILPLFIAFIVYYTIGISYLIPFFFFIKKIRSKRLVFFKNASLVNLNSYSV